MYFFRILLNNNYTYILDNIYNITILLAKYNNNQRHLG